MKPILIIKAGDKLPSLATCPGDFEDWIRAGRNGLRFLVVDVRNGARLPPPGELAGAVMTGSNAMVTDGLDWAGQTAGWLRTAVEAGLPVLGICFGHQLLAHALGGRVGDNPAGVEVGTVEVKLTAGALADALLGGLPPELRLNASHRQAVLALPPGAERLATTARDANHAFRLGDSAWGLQFHPEFNREIVIAYVNHYTPDLERQNESPSRITAASRDTPNGTRVLHRFHAICFPDANESGE